MTVSRRGRTGPIELWAVRADGAHLRRLETDAQPVFVYDWAAG